MSVHFIDLLKRNKLEIGNSKEVLLSSDTFHTWIHGDYPGTKGPMHSQSADEMFYCVKGECTFHFPDRESQAINPGQMILIPKGNLYQLDNTGNEYLVLLGSRGELSGKARFGAKGEKIGKNDYAMKNPKKISIISKKR